jgi:predicted HD superfamily hydrolase involved in NAD metabolism
MNYTKTDMTKTLNWLKDNLTEKRYEHSIGTAECAKELAEKFNLDGEKAYIAGLLHDCAKCYTNDMMLGIMNEHINVSEAERSSWKTWHAPVSCYVAKTIFGVTDEDILSSIRWHTIGKIGMSDFEKIIYIADKIESRTRENYYADPIREALRQPDGLNKAMLQSYKQTIKSLVDRDLVICTETVEIYNYLENLVNVK